MTGRRGRSTEGRFEDLTAPEPNSGCLLWTGAANDRGYGRFNLHPTVQSGTRFAHRVAWEMAHGPVPTGLDVLHRCDTPACVNVRHLFLGDDRSNTADKVAKGRCAKPMLGLRHPSPELIAEGNRKPKLSAAAIDEIVRRYEAREGSQAQIAREFGITQSNVSGLVNRRRQRAA